MLHFKNQLNTPHHTPRNISSYLTYLLCPYNTSVSCCQPLGYFQITIHYQAIVQTPNNHLLLQRYTLPICVSGPNLHDCLDPLRAPPPSVRGDGPCPLPLSPPGTERGAPRLCASPRAATAPSDAARGGGQRGATRGRRAWTQACVCGPGAACLCI